MTMGNTNLGFAIRPTRPEDYSATENVTREAFWNVYVPGCDEHFLLHLMRGSEGFIPELDLVAIADGEVVGNIVCDRSIIKTDAGETLEVLTLGPVSVLPGLQGKGIGGALIEEVKRLAPRLGFEAILLYGDPNYYSRFGFILAEALDIRTEGDMYAEPLQVMELHVGALKGKSGRYIENDVYEIDDQAVIEFDKQFPPKEEITGLPSQLRFQELLQARRPRI
jgi:predicted N-acetyltransferase YhbS